MAVVVNYVSQNQIITDAGNKFNIVETTTLPKPFVDKISTSTSSLIIPESFDVKFSRLKRIFEKDRCVIPIHLKAEDGLQVVYKNVQSNVYLSDDKVEITQNYFIKQCCTLSSSKYHYPMKSVVDNALMVSKAKKFLLNNNNNAPLPILFLIKSDDDDVSTDVLKVFAYNSEIYLKTVLSSSGGVIFVDVSIDRLYHRLLNFIFIPTDNLKHLFSNYKDDDEDEEEEYFGCADSDIRINKRTFQIHFNSLLPYDDVVSDHMMMSKFANVFIQWYISANDNDDDDDISFSKEQIKGFIEKVSVVETFYPIQNTYVFEKFYREYKRVVEEEEMKDTTTTIETIGGDSIESVEDAIDPFCILNDEENNKDDDNNPHDDDDVQKDPPKEDNIFHVDHDVYVYDFKNFTASIFLHFFPDEPILSETIRLLIALKEEEVVPTVVKGFLVKLFGFSKYISNCPFYNFCNNFGIYFMCRLANVFIGKILLCCRDSVFLSEAIDFSIFEDDDDFYVKNLVLENHFNRFIYSDYKHYVGYSSESSVVVLKGFCRKNIPRFQMDLLSRLFLSYFENGNVVVVDDIFQHYDDVRSLTFPYSGLTNARYFYYNRLEDDFFVYSDEVEHRSLDKCDDNCVSSSSFRTIGRCYNLCFDAYLKRLMFLLKDNLVSCILKGGDDVCGPFRTFCGRFMNVCGGSFITPNVMGSYVYSSEYLCVKYGKR